ncbi:MAG: hypothetical protein ACXWUS_18370, partial [Burkholderiales bacterium]
RILSAGGVAGVAWRRHAGALGRRMMVKIERLHGPQGILARTWPVRSIGMWMLAMLLGLLVFGYLG